MADIVVNVTANLTKEILRLTSLTNEQARELATLRLIVTEKFAGADMLLKPEDAADVAKWAAHPEAVRELLSHAPTSHGGERCETCDAAFMEESHRRACAVAAAWRALGDPRGADDIERAHEEALREGRNRPFGLRLASDEEEFQRELRRPRLGFADLAAAMAGITDPSVIPSRFRLRDSDARGMEAVEDEARRANRLGHYEATAPAE